MGTESPLYTIELTDGHYRNWTEQAVLLKDHEREIGELQTENETLRQKIAELSRDPAH